MSTGVVRPAMAVPWTRRDWVVAALLAALAWGVYGALRIRAIYTLDAALLALGVHSYDFASYSPHPPYYALTIALGHVVAWWAGPDKALVWLAVVAGGLIVSGSYVLARQIVGRTGALLAAVSALASPLVLANATVGLSYALEGAAIILVAGMAWRTREDPTRRHAVALGLAAAFAVGLRPSSALVAGPLLLWGAWNRRTLPVAVAAGALATAAWLGPSILLGGGWADYRFGNDYHTRLYYASHNVFTHGGSAALNHLAWVSWLGRRALPLLAAVTALAVLAWPQLRQRTRVLSLLAAWVLPELAFFVFVYAGWPVYPDGYLLGMLPALFLAAAWVADGLVQVAASPRAVPWRAIAVLGLLVLGAVGTSAVAAWDEVRQPIRASQDWQSSHDGFEDLFPANETLVLASYNAPWIILGLPEHQAFFCLLYTDSDGWVRMDVQANRGGVADVPLFDVIRQTPETAPHAIPAWARRIVVVEGHPYDGDFSIVRPGLGTVAQLPGGASVRVIPTEGLTNLEEVLAWPEFLPFKLPPVSPSPWSHPPPTPA